MTSALLLSHLSVSIEVGGLSPSLTCMSCASAIEVGGLTGLSPSTLLTCMSCGTVSTIEAGGLSAIEVGDLSSSLTCMGCCAFVHSVTFVIVEIVSGL